MRLFITGTPGTGKSTVSLALKKAFSIDNAFEIKDLLIKFNLLEEYEPERDTTVFDDKSAIEKIQSFLKSKDNYILAGPPLAFEEIDFTCIIVLTCSKKLILKERLSKRGYKNSKISENLEAELLGEILGEIMDTFSNKNKILVLDSCKLSVQELITKIHDFLQK